VNSGEQLSISGIFTITVSSVSCFSGSYSSGTLKVGEMLDFAVSDFNSEVCSSAEFSFTSNGEGLPSFLLSSGSTLSASPTSNEELGEYHIEATITHEGNSEVISSFTITVQELVASSNGGGASIATSLGNSGITIKVNFDY